MKAGKTVLEMAAALEARQARRKDYAIDARELTVLTSKDEGTTLSLRPGGTTVADVAPQHLMMRQLGQFINIPAATMDRLQAEYPPVFDGLVNGILKDIHAERDGKAQRRIIRTYESENGGPGVGRALLGDGYRIIENIDIANTVLPIIVNEIPDAEVKACEVTDTKMYIKVVVPTLGVNLKDLIKPGTHHMLPPGPDTVQPGFVITNSEVGAAAFSIEDMLFRLVCTNGMIVGKMLSRRHVGSKVEVAEDYTIYSDETRQKDDAALMAKVGDAVRHVVDETKFRALAQQFADTTTGQPMEDPIEGMKVLSQKVGLTEGEGKTALQHLLREGDLSQFGAVNAVTRAAQDVADFDRSIELEQLGATVMAMPTAEWEAVAAAA